MSVGDMPMITGSAYGSNTSTFGLSNISQTFPNDQLAGLRAQAAMVQPAVKPAAPKKEKPMTSPRRLVQVFIADPDENLPLEKAMLYRGEQKFTDATDQELYFEIDIKSILEKHNAARVQVVNRKVKERIEYLEPAKIRDLKMVVVNVATF